jgi:dihydroorotate dehydrogenase
VDLYRSLLRPALFHVDPEAAHRLAMLALRWELPWRLIPEPHPGPAVLRTVVAGIELANPIGLAAGVDKTGRAIPGLARLGFGYLVVGSFTRLPRVGNARPRLLRHPDREAIVNHLGLPNPGIDRVRAALRRLPAGAPPVVASVAGFNASELLDGAAALEPSVSAIEIGLICPNTTAEEQSDELEKLEAVAEGLRAQRRKPVFVKLPPFHDEAQRAHVLRMADLCAAAGLEGVSVSGTRRTRDPGLAASEGSLAGRPVFQDTLRMVGEVAQRIGGRVAIKASGGAFDGDDAAALLDAGANTVEVYSAFIYRGPFVARSMSRELVAALARRGSASGPRASQPPAAPR